MTKITRTGRRVTVAGLGGLMLFAGGAWADQVITHDLVGPGAAANALMVSSAGRIGVGTANPSVNVHAVTGNTPTLRLDQNGSARFSPQVRDIAGNETNFFVRDVTNGSKLSFRIEPNAPTNALYVDSTGDIGIGTNSAAEPLHVRRSDGGATLLVEETNATTAPRILLDLINNGGAILRMRNTATELDWAIAHENAAPNRLVFSAAGGAHEMILTQQGNLTVAGTLTTTGSCATPCDLMFDPGTEILPIDQRAAVMYDLGDLPNVGPTPEAGQYDLTQKVLGMLDELEHAHTYVAQRIGGIEQLEARLALAD